MNGLKLFVWEEVLADYTDGVCFALAHDVKEAKALLLKKCDYVPVKGFPEPRIIEEPEGFVQWGGG